MALIRWDLSYWTLRKDEEKKAVNNNNKVNCLAWAQHILTGVCSYLHDTSQISCVRLSSHQINPAGSRSMRQYNFTLAAATYARTLGAISNLKQTFPSSRRTNKSRQQQQPLTSSWRCSNSRVDSLFQVSVSARAPIQVSSIINPPPRVL